MSRDALGRLLDGKTVLITGAGPNIGRSLALEMASQGAEILFTEIDEDQLRKLDRELRSTNVPCRGYRSDITDEGDVDRLVDSLKGAGIEILVNNVGLDPLGSPGGGGFFDGMENFLRTNVLGPLSLTSRISEQMIAGGKGGVILFVTSIHQWVVRRNAIYSASKAALGMVIRELALELAPHQIRVNGIAPGFVRVGGNGRTVRHKYTPLYGSSIEPSYIGRAAVFLASDYFSRCTTGAVVTVDAGLSLYNHLVDQGT